MLLGAVLRVPAPIPCRLPAPPTRPLLLCRRSHRVLPEAPMASSTSLRGADASGATKPDAAPVPQPPEKPLPGDCCGSGCVRCVWDVYYDELDAYNKALAAHLSAGSDGKPPADSRPSDDVKS